jgi:tetratricopeptide (TPR) repeat protein
MTSLVGNAEQTSLLKRIEELKTEGNNAFKANEHQKAIDLFTEALDALNEYHEKQKQEQADQPSTESDNSSKPSSTTASSSTTISPTVQQEAVIYCNRSLCYGAMNNWTSSIIDATRSTKLNSRYVKAHFRLVKGLIELQKYREARLSLSYAFKECGESTKEFKSLEEELFQLTRIPMRPKPNDFDILLEIGNGNYSQVYKVQLKSTKDIYAVKVSLACFFFPCVTCFFLSLTLSCFSFLLSYF